MSALVLGINAVRMDEPCFGLSEVDLQSPGSRGVHRYRILYVVRCDRLAEMRLDMGPAKKHARRQQFRIPGGVINETTGRGEILHTVGELIDIADFLTRDDMPTDLTHGYYDTLDIRRRRLGGRCQFGYQKAGRITSAG